MYEGRRVEESFLLFASGFVILTETGDLSITMAMLCGRGYVDHRVNIMIASCVLRLVHRPNSVLYYCDFSVELA
jgi:hypothetical protein